MRIHSNYWLEDKTYDTENDLKEIQELIDRAVSNNINTICSTGTVIKIKDGVKFSNDRFLPTGYFSTNENRKEILKIISNLKGVTVDKENISINNKKYNIVDEFKEAMTILDYLNLLEKCEMYEIDAVSNNKDLSYEERRLGEKYFLVGDEKNMIEWAVENQIWKWLEKVD